MLPIVDFVRVLSVAEASAVEPKKTDWQTTDSGLAPPEDVARRRL